MAWGRYGYGLESSEPTAIIPGEREMSSDKYFLPENIPALRQHDGS